MLPTVGQVLALDAVRRGQPRVVAGQDKLGTPVRWVHAIELADAGRLLRGGELVLTTGIALPDDEESLAEYVAGLAGAGVSALAVELGRRYTAGLPEPFTIAAEKHGLPLIVFEREVPFVEITEAVHARIIDDQLGELRTVARLHEVFTDLAVAGAGAAEVVRQAALLAGRPVILEDLAHRVLAFEAADADPARLLERFEARSRAVRPRARTAYDEPSGWLVTTVGARGEDWGRVILVCGGPPRASDTVLVERAATTLALGRLLARQHESLERQAHGTLISAIMTQAHLDPDEAAVRARALGVPVTGRQLVPVVVRFHDGGPGLPAQARVLEVADGLAATCRARRIPALVGSLDDARAGALLSLDRAADAEAVLTEICGALRQRMRRRSTVAGSGTSPHRAPRRTPADARPTGADASRSQTAVSGAGPDGPTAKDPAPNGHAPGGPAPGGPAPGGPAPGGPAESGYAGSRSPAPGVARSAATGSLAAAEGPVIGVGSAARSMAEARRSLLEALQVADAAAKSPPGAGDRAFFRLADLRLRGLIHLLNGDGRLATFVDRELGPLLSYDAAHGTDLAGVLAAYLAAGGNKAEAAARSHLARPTFYERLRHIERILNISLDSPESRASLHVALIARDAAGS